MERIYVANLPPDIRIKDIDDFFRPFGKLVYIDVNHRANPVFAYVQFDNARNAFNAVKARHGYDYEGYTLQLRLVENEVRTRRDATPPPPPPPLFSNFGRQNMNGSNYFNNRLIQNYSANSSNSQWPSNNQYKMEQFQTGNRPNIPQKNMEFSSSNRSNMPQLTFGSHQNMEQQFANTGRSNIQQQYPYSSGSHPNMEQQFANTGRSNIQQFPYSSGSHPNMEQQFANTGQSNSQQQYSDVSRSSMQHQYSNTNDSNMQQQYYNFNRSNIQQQYTDISRPNIPNPNNQQQYTDLSRPNIPNPNNFNGPPVEAQPRFTSGLSGSGRKWFNRYLSKGFSPEMARMKALEHRRLPYIRGDPINKSIINDPTNATLETIGNTIISLFSANPGESNQTRNMEMAGPSTLGPSQAQNAVSRRQYLKSLDILKKIENKREKSSKDRISLKYHTQIVKDYQKLNGARTQSIIAKNTLSKNETPLKYRPIISTRSEEEISELMRKQKAKLSKKSKELESENRRKRIGTAYKKRVKILMDHGFLEMEAKSLAWNPLNMLEELLALKREYDLLAKKTVFIPASKASLANAPKSVVYRNDLQYLEEYAKHRIKGLSKTILRGLTECIKRIHAYEKSENLPLTENKFTKLLLKITSREGFFKEINKPSLRKRKSLRAAASGKDVKKSEKPKLTKEVKVENQSDANVTEDIVNDVNDIMDQNNEDRQDNDKDEDNHEFEDIQANGELGGDQDSVDVDEDNNQGATAGELNVEE